MGIVFRRFKRLLTRLQTAWSIFGITLVLLLVAGGGFRIGFGASRCQALCAPC
jgi:hypothetical protein